jgi:hypothetical protein
MVTLQTVYMMAFTPEKMENNMLMAVCQMAADRLASKNNVFAQRMSMRDANTRMVFSNQLYIATLHTPQSMQSTLAGWLQNENVPSDFRIGDNFFPYGLRDPQGRENYVLLYFDVKE